MAVRGRYLTSVAAMAMAGLAGPAPASPPPAAAGGDYHAYAEVVEVAPRYGWHEVAEPVRECVRVAEPHRPAPRHGHVRHVREHHPRTEGAGSAATLVGGLVGGLIGHQFGGGNGRTALTIAGATVGASIARDHAARGHAARGHYREHGSRGRYYDAGHDHRALHCTQTTRSRRVRGVDGYDVTYRYQGATFHKWMDEHPGDAVRVHVAVEPLGRVR